MTLLERSPSALGPLPRQTQTVVRCDRFLAGWSAVAFALLAAEMAVAHLAFTQALTWKLVPVAYCLWAAALSAIIARRPGLSPSAAWAAAGSFALGIPVAAVGIVLHWRGDFLHHMIAEGRTPATSRWVPLILAGASAAAILACLPALSEQARRGWALVLAAVAAGTLTAVAAVDHARAGWPQGWLTAGAGLVLPAASVAAAAWGVIRHSHRRARVLGLAAGLAMTIAGLIGTVAHMRAGLRADRPAAWLVPQAAPIGGPVALAGLGLLLIGTVGPWRPSEAQTGLAPSAP